MKTTFCNAPSNTRESRAQFKKTGIQNLNGRAKDFNFFHKYGIDEDGADNRDKWRAKADKLGVNDFWAYGLSIDYVAPNTFEKQREGYLRYQLSYGGPSEEIRFYYSCNAREAYRIEYVYMDWGTGIGLDITEIDWAKWLYDWFKETGQTTIKEEDY